MIRVLMPFALLGGCAALRPAERVDTMRLAPHFAVTDAARLPGGVVVAPVAAEGAVAERRYVYVLASDPLLLRRAATLFWELPPPMTLSQALNDALRTRYAEMDGGPAVGRLSTRLLRFEEVADGTRARAFVATEATLLPATRGLATTARYCRATPIGAEGSGARAAAFQASVGAVAAAVAGDVAAGRMKDSPC